MKDNKQTYSTESIPSVDYTSITEETPTNELRYVFRDDPDLTFEQLIGFPKTYKTKRLQQKWKIVTFINHIAHGVRSEWRDVPEVDET